MEWIEVTGRTLEEAVERALDSLGVHETELDYEVLTEPKTSLLGLKRTEARIRARVKPRSREKPNDKRRRQRDEQRSRRRSSRDRSGDQQRTNAPSSPAPSAPTAGGKAAGSGNGQADGAAGGTGGGSSSSRSRRRRRGGRSGGQRTNAANGAARDTKVDTRVPADDEEQDVTERSGSIEEQVSAGREFATGLLEAFDARGTVSVEPDDNEIEISIVGDNLGLLVGPKGATLAALEELLRGAVGHRGPGRLHLDVAGYRAKRRAALAEFARRVAEDVRTQGSAKALEPMSAPDRKVVHDTVA